MLPLLLFEIFEKYSSVTNPCLLNFHLLTDGVSSIDMYAFSYFYDRAVEMGLIGKSSLFLHFLKLSDIFSFSYIKPLEIIVIDFDVVNTPYSYS